MRVQDRVALARAVTSSPRARLLSPDNTASAPLALERAAGSGSAYFVTPRRDLLVIDLDLPHDTTQSGDVLAAFDMLMDAAAQHGVAHLALPSGRPGHRHGYLVTGTGPGKARLERWCKDRGLDVRTYGIRPPGSPHRTGRGAAWEAGYPLAHALAVLASDANDDATAALAGHLCPLALPGRVQVAVRHGHARAGYESASHARMALAVAVRARGGTAGLVDTILRDPASPLGVSFRAKPASWQRVEVARVWAKACAWVDAGGRPAPELLLGDVAAAAQSWPWKGASGGSDLAVLEELVRTGAAVPTTVVGASLGAIAMGAGVSVDTARAALLRLGGAGWLRVVSQETAVTTRTYALRVPAGADLSGDRHVPARDEFGDLGADLARWRGLGKVSVRVARLIDRSPHLTAGELGERLSMSAPAMRYHLRKLSHAGLVSLVGAGWVVHRTAELVAGVAARLGVAGARVRQRAVWEAQRAVRAAARVTFAKLRRWSGRPPGVPGAGGIPRIA